VNSDEEKEGTNINRQTQTQTQTNERKEQSTKLLNNANQIRKQANDLFGSGKHKEALLEYEKCLSMLQNVSPLLQEENLNGFHESKLLCMLNKAACLLKIGGKDREVIETCTSALLLQPANEKALYRRARALVNIGNYETAKKDLDFLIRKRADDETIKSLLKEVNDKLSQTTSTTNTTPEQKKPQKFGKEEKDNNNNDKGKDNDEMEED
jgi:tetratricopeptide (TPR) repeat protein